MSTIVAERLIGTNGVLAARLGRYWAIDFADALAISEVLGGASLTELEDLRLKFEARQGSMRQTGGDRYGYTVRKDGAAVVELVGPMTKRPHCLAELFGGGASTMQAIEALENAKADPEVKDRWVKLETPGGEVGGAFDMADYVYRERRSDKPIYTYAEDQCTSAGVLVSTQSSGSWGNSNLVGGSIGVMTTMIDSSKAAADRGIKVILVKAGEHKGIGTPGVKVEEPHIAKIQERVDDFHKLFKGLVTRGTGMRGEDLARVSDASTFVGKRNVEVGLLDGVASFDEAIEAARSGKGRAENKGRFISMAGTAKTKAEESAADDTTSKDLLEADEILEEAGVPPVATATEEGTITVASATGPVQVSLADASAILAELNVTSVTAAHAVNERAVAGDLYLDRVRASAKKLAIVAHGDTAGLALAADIDKMSLNDTLAAMSNYRSLNETAGRTGTGATRQTAPVPAPGAVQPTGPSAAGGEAKLTLKERIENERASMRQSGLV